MNTNDEENRAPIDRLPYGRQIAILILLACVGAVVWKVYEFQQSLKPQTETIVRCDPVGGAVECREIEVQVYTFSDGSRSVRYPDGSRRIE